ncbi:MAG: hypothetical protein JO166_13320 [Deltaproteobacteria bacterium]|nr:hypothetical protein [Deltaproteobacteria bacterium]
MSPGFQAPFTGRGAGRAALEIHPQAATAGPPHLRPDMPLVRLLWELLAACMSLVWLHYRQISSRIWAAHPFG